MISEKTRDKILSTRPAAIVFGLVAVVFYPIAMAVAARDLTYLYIGIGGWVLLGFGLYGMYRRFKHVINPK